MPQNPQPCNGDPRGRGFPLWIAGCPAILGCISQSGTRVEAVEDVRGAILGCLAADAKL